MNLSVAQIYFLIVFGVHFYAYYLFNRIGNTYEKSEDRCDGLSEYGFKLGTMILNTLMFIGNLCIFKRIIDYMNTSREYRTSHHVCELERIDVDTCIPITSLIRIVPIIVINIAIGKPCFRNKFASLYYHYVLIMSMLTITMVSNCVLYAFTTNSVTNTKILYKLSDMYKKINSNYKMFFAFGVGVLHVVSMFLFNNGNDYSTDTQNYLNVIFWIGHFIDGFNLIVLFYDDYADGVMVVLAILSFINNLIIGIILGITVDYFSYQTGLMLVFANVFFGLCVGYFVVLGLIHSSICTVAILNYAIISIPLVLLGFAYVCIGILWVVNLFGGLGLEVLEDGHYFKNLFDNYYKMCSPYIGFANTNIRLYVGFINYLFGQGPRPNVVGTNPDSEPISGVGTNTVLNTVLVKETNTV